MEEYIDACLKEASLAYDEGEIPVGAVLVNGDGLIAKAHNTKEKDHNILAHAEINAILMASQKLERWNLFDCDLIVSLKPCSMCMSVIKQARIKNVYYILDKLDFKKEYDKTEFVKINTKHEQRYAKMLANFFKNMR